MLMKAGVSFKYDLCFWPRKKGEAFYLNFYKMVSFRFALVSFRFRFRLLSFRFGNYRKPDRFYDFYFNAFFIQYGGFIACDKLRSYDNTNWP